MFTEKEEVEKIKQLNQKQNYPLFWEKYINYDFKEITSIITEESSVKKETFLFDYIKSKDDLKIPIEYHNLISEPLHEEIKKFNDFLIQIYHDKNLELEYYIKQIIIPNVPKSILINYWIKIFFIEEFSNEINKDLKHKIGNKFDVYVRMLYFGLKRKYLKTITNEKLYRSEILTKEEIEEIKKIKQSKKKDQLPNCLCFTKSLLTFSRDEKIAFESIKKPLESKNQYYVIFEIEKSESQKNNNQNEGINEENATNINIETYNLDKKEVLFLPFSCFEIDEEPQFINSKYYLIKLKYIGKYKKLFNEEELKNLKGLRETKFIQNLLDSKILDEKNIEIIKNNIINDTNESIMDSSFKVKIKISKKKLKDEEAPVKAKEEAPLEDNVKKIVNEEESYIKIEKEKKENYILAEYNIEKNDVDKEIQIINCNNNSNKNEIENGIEIELNEQTVKFSFKKKFNKVGTYKIKFKFLKTINNLSHLFEDCSKLCLINFDNYEMEKVEDISYMFKNCISLKELSLNKTTSVRNMSYMFYGCSNLESVNFSNFKAKKIEDISYMFYKCFNLAFLQIYLHIKEKAFIENAFTGVRNCSLITNDIGIKNFKK